MSSVALQHHLGEIACLESCLGWQARLTSSRDMPKSCQGIPARPVNLRGISTDFGVFGPPTGLE